MKDENVNTKWEDSIEHARAVVGCVIYKDGKFLMIQEKQSRARGLWNLPAGHVDKGESLEAAAIREAKEETGYDVELIAEIGIYHHEARASIKHAYEARIVGGRLQVESDEIMNAVWLGLQEVEDINRLGKLRAPWNLRALHDYCAKHGIGRA